METTHTDISLWYVSFPLALIQSHELILLALTDLTHFCFLYLTFEPVKCLKHTATDLNLTQGEQSIWKIANKCMALAIFHFKSSMSLTPTAKM